jgi:ubiquinone/menaquinone biosynthesis C-methylase UbiE
VSAHVPSAVSYFHDLAARYDGHYEKVGFNGYALRSRLAAVHRGLGPARGSVLDAGMGGGRLCAELADAGWEPSGIDPAEAMVEIARARVPAADERLVVGRLEEIPFPDSSFDAVVATGSLEYADVPRALEELARVLRPGGCAVVTYPNPEAWYAYWKTRVYYTLVRAVKRAARRPHADLPRGFGVIPPSRFVPLLSGRGLAPQSVTYTSYAPLLTPIDALLPRLAERLGAACERRGIWSRRLSTQIVYAARKADA